MRTIRRAQGLWNGLVSAKRAKQHMLRLSRHGVGRRTIRLKTKVADSVLSKIRSGERVQIRALTEKAILSVSESDIRGSALIDARPTWVKIDWLLAEGFTKAAISKMMGNKTPALQLSKEIITVYSAKKIEKIWMRYQ